MTTDIKSPHSAPATAATELTPATKPTTVTDEQLSAVLQSRGMSPAGARQTLTNMTPADRKKWAAEYHADTTRSCRPPLGVKVAEVKQAR